jgi:hypothetical protein
VNLPEFPELQFDEEKHLYTLNMHGQILQLPSVTQILRFVTNEIYKDIPVYVLEAAADKGSRVHEAIEMMAKYGWMEADTEILGYILAYQEWEKKHNYQALETEYPVYHKTRMYAGRIDRIFLDNDDICIMDIKTGQSVFELLTAAQLYGYVEALKSHDIQVKRAYILHLKENSEYDWIEADLNKGSTLFECCAYLHSVLKEV